MTALGLERVSYPHVSLGLGAGWRRRIGLALIAWWCGARLDRQLAVGTSPLLAVRAKRITKRRTRLRIADGMARVVRDAQTTVPAFSAAVQPHRREVRAAGTVLRNLERRLRAPEPVTARGVAMLQALLSEPASPLYRPHEPGALGSRLRAAAAALEPLEHAARPGARPEPRRAPGQEALG